MSNLERDPSVALLAAPVAEADGFELLEPRLVPLGGPRAMPVRRTLPQRGRSLIGAWCFLDHYGPEPQTMTVPPHPHTGLATVSWLFAGEIAHRDSTGAAATVRPGELNLMTAGRGIQHSEVSVDPGAVLHGAQLWLALPDIHRHRAPFFESVVAEVVRVDAATLHVFIGALAGASSTATTFSPLVGAQLDVPARSVVELPVDPAFEHGVLVDAGDLALESHRVPEGHLGYVPPGRSSLRVTTGDRAARALLIGGEPFGERIVMWWNFVGRGHDEVVAFREQWQREVIEGGARSIAEHGGRFGSMPDDLAPLPAPELPNVRLAPRA